MTKTNIIALADVIRDHNERAAENEGFKGSEFTSDHIRSLADFIGSVNPRFMRARWLDYIAGRCGPNGGPVKK